MALLPAAGGGQRCGTLKQFAPLAAQTVLWHAVQPFLACPQVGAVRVVVAADKMAQAQAALADCKAGAVEVLPCGGETRAASVCNGLAEVADDTWVLVHDAARPCLSAAALARLLAYVESGGEDDGAALALPLDEAVKRVEGGRIVAAVARGGLWAMQTPQLFRAGRLRQALRQCPDAADEAEAVLHSGGRVAVIPGERRNIKITVAEDLPLAARWLKEEEA